MASSSLEAIALRYGEDKSDFSDDDNNRKKNDVESEPDFMDNTKTIKREDLPDEESPQCTISPLISATNKNDKRKTRKRKAATTALTKLAMLRDSNESHFDYEANNSNENSDEEDLEDTKEGIKSIDPKYRAQAMKSPVKTKHNQDIIVTSNSDENDFDEAVCDESHEKEIVKNYESVKTSGSVRRGQKTIAKSLKIKKKCRKQNVNRDRSESDSEEENNIHGSGEASPDSISDDDTQYKKLKASASITGAQPKKRSAANKKKLSDLKRKFKGSSTEVQKTKTNKDESEENEFEKIILITGGDDSDFDDDNQKSDEEKSFGKKKKSKKDVTSDRSVVQQHAASKVVYVDKNLAFYMNPEPEELIEGNITEEVDEFSDFTIKEEECEDDLDQLIPIDEELEQPAMKKQKMSNLDAMFKWTDEEEFVYNKKKVLFIPQEVDYPDELLRPIDYFFMFFTPEMFEYLADESLKTWQKSYHEKQSILEKEAAIKRAADPKKRDRSLKDEQMSTTPKEDPVQSLANKTKDELAKELQVFIAIILFMGVVQLDSVRDYWSSKYGQVRVSELMSRNRFAFLLQCLRFRRNDDVSANEKKKNRMWKMQKWFDLVNANFKKVPFPEHLSVDEQMVKFKDEYTSRYFLKQLMPKKPTKWGFKVWALAAPTGFVHKFKVYTGKRSDDEISAQQTSRYGMAGQVVLDMIRDVPPFQNHKIFSDRFFNSIWLFAELNKRGYHAVGTVLPNRLVNAPLTPEKDLQKMPRGTWKSCFEEKHAITAVQWVDNKVATLASTYVGIEPMDKCKRYDRKLKKSVEIDRPAIIKEYNTFMGGVDVSDQIRTMYAKSLKCKRWYIYLFMYTLHLMLRNAWTIHRRDAKELKVKHLGLKDFIFEVFQDLTDEADKRTVPLLKFQKKVDKKPAEHLPIVMEKSRRCSYCSSNGIRKSTKAFCELCQTGLCLTYERNCFKLHHTVDNK